MLPFVMGPLKVKEALLFSENVARNMKGFAKSPTKVINGTLTVEKEGLEKCPTLLGRFRTDPLNLWVCRDTLVASACIALNLYDVDDVTCRSI